MSTMLDAMPTLGDALGGAKPTLQIRGRSRIHRMVDDEDRVDEPAPPESPLRDLITPKSKPRADRITEAKAPGKAEVKAAKATRGRGPAKARKPAQVGAARFQIDDCGGMSIEDGQQVIKLERDDVARLSKFLEQTKAIRG